MFDGVLHCLLAQFSVGVAFLTFFSPCKRNGCLLPFPGKVCQVNFFFPIILSIITFTTLIVRSFEVNMVCSC